MASPMKTRLLLLASFFQLFMGVSANRALGQAPPPVCFNDPPCKALSERAKQQSASGNFAEAFRLYKLAYGVSADPAILFNLARVLHKQGRAGEAIPYYRQYIDSSIEDSEQKRKARDYLQQAELAQPEPTATEQSASAVSTEGAAASTILSSSPTAPLSVAAPKDPGAQSKPIVKRWWFWVAIGGFHHGTL